MLKPPAVLAASLCLHGQHTASWIAVKWQSTLIVFKTTSCCQCLFDLSPTSLAVDSFAGSSTLHRTLLNVSQVGSSFLISFGMSFVIGSALVLHAVASSLSNKHDQC